MKTNQVGCRRAWSESELRQLRAHYPDATAETVAQMLGRTCRSIYQKAKELGLSKSSAFLASDRSGRVLRGHMNARMMGTQFKAGFTPWNKGIKGSTGTHEACRANQFRPGRPADESRNYRPIGTLRISKDGYLERKVTDDPTVYPAKRWVAEHRLVWEAAHGAIAGGQIVVFRPGMKTTTPVLVTLDRLECISRAENMRRNSYHQYGPEVAALHQLRGAITRQINKRAKEQTT